MSVLRNLESKLAGLVEGTFSRAFKSEVRPVEIARKLAREMDEHRVQSLSRTYVPNEFSVWLSPGDRQQFESYEDELRRELSGYLLEHARRERVALLTPPEITFKTDERLRLGEFGIQARLVRPHEDPASEPHQGEEGHTMVYSTSSRLSEPLREPDPRRASARLRIDGRTELLGSDGATLGRSREADIVIDDANVSRKHAEVRPSGGSWTVRDLGSTNGVKVNGRRLDASRPQSLKPGDVIELGTSRATFELE
jgi:FhaA, N-terminal domain/FHA domain